MRAEEHDFGQASSIDAEAIGPPGQRRFRITVMQEDGAASLWLEKEQLAALGTAMEQQLVRTDRQRRRIEPTDDEGVAPFPLNPTLDLRVSQIALGYDESKSLFHLQAAVVDSADDHRTTFTCSATHGQARRLIGVISRLMSAGRPSCPLCGAIIEGEHICPRSNGHAEVAIL
jgi:uncharacterized repeat protein (TIGR03847 family)